MGNFELQYDLHLEHGQPIFSMTSLVDDDLQSKKFVFKRIISSEDITRNNQFDHTSPRSDLGLEGSNPSLFA